ncbi:hypothetical protein AB5N19_13970 [Seiridium cardinale]
MEDLTAATDFGIGLPLLATIASALHQQPSTVLKVREERSINSTFESKFLSSSLSLWSKLWWQAESALGTMDQMVKDGIPKDMAIPMPIAKLTPRPSPSETRTKSNIMLERYSHTLIGSDTSRTSISSSWKSKDYMMAPFKPGAGLIQVGLKQWESREQGTVKVSDIRAYAVFYQNTNTQDTEHLIRRNNELKITSDRYRPSVARIGQPAHPSMNVTGLPTHNENLVANDEDLVKKSKNPQGWCKKWFGLVLNIDKILTRFYLYTIKIQRQTSS